MLCGICAHPASTAPTYNLVKAANLDRDERRERIWQIRSESSLFFSSPDCSQPQEERNHPASFKLLSPSASLSVSLIRPPGLYLIHFYTALRLQPLLSPPTNKFSPRMIKKQTRRPWCPLSLFSPAVLFVAYWGKIDKVRSDRSEVFVPWQLFNFDGHRSFKSTLLLL